MARISIDGMNEIPQHLSDQLPEAVLRRLQSLNPVTQEAFLTEFRKRKKSTFMAYLLWFVFPAWHYFYLGKVWLNLLFWITFGGLGIWWFIDLFRIYGMVREYNKSVAIRTLQEIQFLG